MAAPTAQQLLDAAKTAKLRILGGFASAEWNGRSYTEHDLDKLDRAIARLEAEVGRSAGLRVRTVVPRG